MPCFFFFTFIKFTYEDIILWIVNHYNLSDKLLAFKNEYFTSARYRILGILSFIGAFVWAWLTFYCFQHRIDILDKLFRTIQILFSPIANCWHALSNFQKRITSATFFIIFLVRIGLAMAFPPHTDEMFSYYFLVKHGLAAVIAYYPGPNNHIGYLWLPSLLQNILPPIIAMRVPVLIYATLHSLFLFALLRKYIPFAYSIMVLLIVDCSVFVLFYSVHGRGYVLILLCALLLYHLSINLSDKTHQSLWIGFSAWGFFTIPIFIFIWAAVAQTLNFLYRKSNKAQICLVKLFLMTAVLVGILYFPILLFNGYESLIFNSWVSRQGVSWSSTVRYLWQWDMLFDADLPTLPVTFLSSCTLVIYQYVNKIPKRWNFYVWLFTFLSCLFSIFYVAFMRSTPPLRIFTPLSVVCIVFWLSVYFQVLQKFHLDNRRWIQITNGLCTLVFCTYFITFQYQNRYGIQNEYYYAEEVCDFLEKQKAFSVGTDSYLIYIKMQYKHGDTKNLDIQTLPSASSDILVLRKSKELSESNKKKVLFENALFKVVANQP